MDELEQIRLRIAYQAELMVWLREHQALKDSHWALLAQLSARHRELSDDWLRERSDEWHTELSEVWHRRTGE